MFAFDQLGHKRNHFAGCTAHSSFNDILVVRFRARSRVKAY